MMIMNSRVRKPIDKVRSSISFPQEIYATLEEIAYEKRVSLAWVVREAVVFYLKGQKEGKNAKDR